MLLEKYQFPLRVLSHTYFNHFPFKVDDLFVKSFSELSLSKLRLGFSFTASPY